MPMLDQLDPELATEFARLDSLPPEARFARAEELLHEAQVSKSFAQEFVARKAVASTTYYVPNDPAHLVHFAWLRRAIEAHPEVDDQDRWHVLWMLKWALSLTWGMPQVSLTDIRRMIDDLERVHAAHGYGVRPATEGRARLARARGDQAGAAAAVREWLATPRDQMSDCEACERQSQAELMSRTDLAWAISHLTPVLGRELTCDSQPLEAMALAAALHEQSGDRATAAELALEAWRTGKDRRELPRTVSSILTTLTRVGNVDRALTGLLPRLSWIDELTHDQERLDYAATAALVLDVAMGSGLAPQQVDGRPVNDVITELRETAGRLAAAFDTRNGSTVESDRLRETWDDTNLADTPTLPPLLVAASAGPGTRAVEDTRTVAERADVLRRLLDEASHRVEDEVNSWLRDRERLLETETSNDTVKVAFLDRVACRLLPADQQRARLAESLARAESAGDTIESRRARAELLLLDADPGDPSTLAMIASIADSLESDGELQHAAAVWLRMAADAPLAQKAELAHRSAECSRRNGNPVREALALCDVARVALSGGDDEARPEELLTRAEALAPDHTGVRATAYSLRWRMIATTGDLDGAIALLRTALALPDLGRGEAGLRIDLCDLMVDTHQYDVLAIESDRLMAMALELRDPSLLAMAQRYRGLAHVESGEFVEGGELLESALPVIRERAPWLVGPTGWALGNALTGLAEPSGARTAFATAALGFEAQERYEEQAHAQLRAGGAAWDAGDLEAAAAHMGQAAELARTHLVVPVFQRATRDLAALACQSGELAAGLEALDRVPDESERFAREAGVDLTPEDSAALRRSVLRQGAYLMADRSDYVGAVDRLRIAETEATDPEEVLVIRADQGRFLASSDQIEDAATLLRSTLPHMAADHLRGLRIQAAGSWATALDKAGRTDEADAVWTEFGPDA